MTRTVPTRASRDAWKKAGLPVAVDRGQPIEIMRQVQITAGALG